MKYDGPRYRVVQRGAGRFAVRDIERQNGGHWWPFHQLSESFETSKAALQLAGMLNAIAALAEPWIEDGYGNPRFCFGCGNDEPDGHMDDCPWVVLKGVL